ncbi:MAG: hypothetical protein KDI30_06580 [Pseudomonadales bacterium]|nr:hypothetical protein [Pseudomonadales bacterium]
MVTVCILLIIIAILVWRIYSTVDSFNEDLKQLRILVGHIERHLSNITDDDGNRFFIPGGNTHSINTIQKNELCSLLMIDPQLAEMIISARPYRSLDEIGQKVENISDAVMKEIFNKCTL